MKNKLKFPKKNYAQPKSLHHYYKELKCLKCLQNSMTPDWLSWYRE